MNWFSSLRIARAIRGSTAGRDEEKKRYGPFLPDAEQRRLLFDVIGATYDLAEGRGTRSRVAEAAREVFEKGDSRAWQNTAEWLQRTTPDLAEVADMWRALADNPNWQIRWRVACLLYSTVPEALSDRLFLKLRSDRSSKVRHFAIQRYEWRAVPDGPICVMRRVHDAALFDERVRSGETTL